MQEGNSLLKVVHDPVFVNNQKVIASPWANPNGIEPYVVDDLKENGYRIPLILLNKLKVLPEDINKFHLEFEDFFPTLTLRIYDPQRLFRYNDIPGNNNEVVIVLTPDMEGTYKKIKLSFYISDCLNSGDFMTYNCVLKYLPLENVSLKGYNITNTYEFLRQVALDTGLGFATSENVQSVQDNHTRIIQSKPLKNAIKEQVGFAGVDENSIMDCWVDAWGYLNLINISYITKTIDNNLKIKAEIGHHSSDKDAPKRKAVESDLVLTNFSELGYSNLQIKSYKSVVDNSNNYLYGNSFQYQTMHPEGVGENKNGITSQDVISPGNDSKDMSQYEFPQYEFAGIEMEDVPILQQKNFHNIFMQNLNGSCLEITMAEPNLGLLKGGKCNIIIVEYDTERKLDNLNKNENPMEYLEEDSAPVIDKNLTGQYYIRAIHFDYDINVEEIVQKLYCFKIAGMEYKVHSPIETKTETTDTSTNTVTQQNQ
jgi:hypothetical protein